LFGQAGFLEEELADDYSINLKKEYNYCKRKYNLKSIDRHLWKFLRLRPLNFPTIRIAQLSNLLANNSNLLSRTMDCLSLEDLYSVYSCGVSDYWKTHYIFGKQSTRRNKNIGKKTIHKLIINAIVPIMFVYGKMKNHSEIKERAINLLEQIPPEANHITMRWNNLGFKLQNASESQALLQLTDKYCSKKRCLDCQIGHLLLNIGKA